MTNQNPDSKPEHIVTFRMPVPSRGLAERFATKRFLYEVRNIEETSPIEVPGASQKTLRASVVLRVFREDYVDSEEKLALFDQLTPGLDLTLRELTHGVYQSNGKMLQILVHGKPARMASYICDPSVTDGYNAFTEIFTMQELLQASSGDDRLDRMLRRGRTPLMGQRVDKHTTGSGVDAVTVDTRSEFRGWVFASMPGKPTVDHDKGTATFGHVDEIGCAVFLPLKTIRLMANLFYKLEPRWRAFIEEEHVVVEAYQKPLALPRRLQLSAGRQAPRKQGGKKEKAKAESTPETEAEETPVEA